MTEQATTLTSAAAARGPLAMEAISVSKDFKIGRGQILHGDAAIIDECASPRL